MLRDARRGTKRRSAVCAAVLTAFLALCAGVAVASTQSLDQRSDASALKLYHSYLKAQISEVPAIKTALSSYIATINAGCHGVLAPLNSPSANVNVTGVVLITEEIEVDLEVAASSVRSSENHTFTSALARLHWTSSARRVVKALLKLDAAQGKLHESQLCSDLTAFANDPTAVPAGTKTFIDGVNKAIPSASAATKFLGLLKRYATRSDRGLYYTVIKTEKQFEKGLGKVLDQATNQLFDDLGITS
jgi:hypothetical protein